MNYITWPRQIPSISFVPGRITSGGSLYKPQTRNSSISRALRKKFTHSLFPSLSRIPPPWLPRTGCYCGSNNGRQSVLTTLQLSQPLDHPKCTLCSFRIDRSVNRAPRLLPVVKVLKIHIYKDLSIAYDKGVDIVRLGVVDFPTTGVQGIASLLAFGPIRRHRSEGDWRVQLLPGC